MSFTFNLPACPVCSHITGPLLLPYWHACHRTSEVRGKPFAIITGCAHVRAIAPIGLTALEDAPAVEALWLAETERLFTERTASWPPASTTRLAIALQRISYSHLLPLEERLSEQKVEEPPHISSQL